MRCMTSKCRQAKQMLRSLTNYALRLPRKDLRILSGLLTGHVNLIPHLTLMKVKKDVLCPLCQEEEEISLHFLGRCSSTMIFDTAY